MKNESLRLSSNNEHGDSIVHILSNTMKHKNVDLKYYSKEDSYQYNFFQEAISYLERAPPVGDGT